MKPEYKRENLIITLFDSEDVITTSMPIATAPTNPVAPFLPDEQDGTDSEKENVYREFNSFESLGSWF